MKNYRESPNRNQ